MFERLTKHRVLQIQLRLSGICEEELAQIRIRSVVGHRNHGAVRVFQIVLEFILEFLSPNRVAAFAGAGRIARLHDEALDIPVEQAVVVVTASA